MNSIEAIESKRSLLYGNKANNGIACSADKFFNMVKEAIGDQTESSFQTEVLIKYGIRITVDEAAGTGGVQNYAMGTVGTGNIVVSPEALARMDREPALREKLIYEIEHYLTKEVPAIKNMLAMTGQEVKSMGMMIGPDGSPCIWVSADLTKEEKEKIEEELREQEIRKKKKLEELRAQTHTTKKVAIVDGEMKMVDVTVTPALDIAELFMMM